MSSRLAEPARHAGRGPQNLTESLRHLATHCYRLQVDVLSATSGSAKFRSASVTHIWTQRYTGRQTTYCQLAGQGLGDVRCGGLTWNLAN